MFEHLYILPVAFILDFVFGDPARIYHPICLIGNGISFIEKIIRNIIKGGKTSQFIGGLILFVLITFLSFAIPFAILNFALADFPIVRILLEIFWCFQILAMTSLKNESMKVCTALKNEDLPEARKFLSYIVGRDTSELSDRKIIRATVETVAENFSDGVIAPMLFIAIGGAPLGFLYKAINTLDSMVGYKNDKYLYFGRVSAKMDDLANFIPARLSAFFLILGAKFLKLDHLYAYKIFIRDRKNHSSPNSAQTESVVAGALNIELGGNSFYFGKEYKKPTIGDDLREPSPTDIEKANNLMIISSIIGCLFIGAIIFIVM